MAEVSPILSAVYEGDTEGLGRLLASQPALDVFEAAAVGDGARIGSLVAEEGSDVLGAFAPDGYQALHLASFFGHADVVEILLGLGADPSARARNQMRVQPLHSAVATSRTDIVRLLLAAGADPKATQEGGWTPLHAAAQNGAGEIVEMLLLRGADPRVPNDAGRTPIDLAAEAGHEAVLDRLRAE
jgi:ankyrin repeat protein